MISIGYENIFPTPGYPKDISAESLEGLEWDSQAIKVEKFKKHLKNSFRKLQQGRCAFCRRHLGDIRDTHLEHFIEKTTHPKFTFTITNLALACSTCNGQKEQERKRLLKILRIRARRHGRPTNDIRSIPSICGSVLHELPPASRYRWVHPHFDVYSSNILIKKDWVYVPRSLKGHRTVRSLKLNDLALMERTARRERMLSQPGLVALLGTALFSESHAATLGTIFSDLSYAIREKRKYNRSLLEYKRQIDEVDRLLAVHSRASEDTSSRNMGLTLPPTSRASEPKEVLKLPAPPKT